MQVQEAGCGGEVEGVEGKAGLRLPGNVQAPQFPLSELHLSIAGHVYSTI